MTRAAIKPQVLKDRLTMVEQRFLQRALDTVAEDLRKR
jgi:hypothetical protein